MTQILDPSSTDFHAPPPPETADVGAFRTFLRAIMRSRTGFAGFLVFAGIVLVCLIGPLVTPDNLPTDVAKIYAPASWAHPMGFDSEGRDVLMQVVNGGRAVILVGFMAALISTVIAVVFGAVAA